MMNTAFPCRFCFVVYVYILLLCCPSVATSQTCNRQQDSLELVKLYNATEGPGWTNTWDLTKPMNTWYGVTLNGQGCVTCIDMDGVADCNNNGTTSGNKLNGSIPDFNLPYLRLLYLNNNKLNGNIPNFNLPNLQFLFLNSNQLSGSIPDFNLPNLGILDLHSNQLSGSIPNFNLPNLKSLHLFDNKLSGSVPNFNLPNLQSLYLYNNQLSGNIPDFNLPNLQSLHLYNNQLSGSIPDFNLPNLRNLYLFDNKLSGSIPNFNPPNLRYISIGNNQLSGSIPNFNLPNLQYLYLEENQLSGSIPNFNLPNLQALYLYTNQLSGNIPNFNLPNLQALDLYSNQLTFDGLLYHVNKNYPSFSYSPQDSVFHDTLLTRTAGQSLTIDLGIDANLSTNVYQWYKNGNPWMPPAGNSSNSNKLIFSNLQNSDAGIYHVRVTNPGAPALTLTSRTITLNIGSAACAAVTNTLDTGPGSLRAAIACATATPGPDTIRFNIPGTGPHIIDIKNEFYIKADTGGLVIDATTQPGWKPGHVVIDGANTATAQYGLFNIDECKGWEFYGLTFRNAPTGALGFTRCRNTKVGAPGKGNIFYDNERSVPATTPADPASYSTNLQLFGCTNATVQSNVFGLTENNAKPPKGMVWGFTASGENILIGGSRSAGEGNTFVHQLFAGLGVWADAGTALATKNIRIYGNNFGTDATGTQQWGNYTAFNFGTNSPNSIMENVAFGGNTADLSNLVKYNKVAVSDYGPQTKQVAIRQNVFACNDAAIVMSFNPKRTVTITAAEPQKISGTALPGDVIDVYLFQNTGCPNTPCQGTTWLGSITANASGNWSLPVSTLATGTLVTATGTGGGQTGAFARCAAVMSTTCTPVTNTLDGGPGSLREAIDCANKNPGPDTIRFNIPGAGPHIIALQTGLPTITDNGTIIDGSTQPQGKIIVDGSIMTSGEILYVTNISGFEVYGLILRNSIGNGIALKDCTNFKVGAPNKGNIVYGNGRLDAPYPYDFINFGNNYNPDIILHNCSNGKVQSNQVGITENNGLPVRPVSHGIAVSGQNILIGGNRSLKEGNIIGNDHNGLSCWTIPNLTPTSNIQFFGNNVGTGITGTEQFGNAVGIKFEKQMSNIQIGSGSDQANLFRFNDEVINILGIGFDNSLVRFNQNIFSCNNKGPMVKTNLAHPLAIQSATIAQIKGTARAGDLIEIYLSENQDCTGNNTCQGSTFVGTTQTNATGEWSFAGNFSVGQKITATATAVAEDWTYGFSNCVTVSTATCAAVTNTLDAGPGSLREAIDCANKNPGPDTIRFNIPGAGPHSILLLSSLPSILGAGTVIEGQSQPGWSLGNIVVDGGNLVSTTTVLGVQADSVAIDGLHLKDCPVGIAVYNRKNVRIGSASFGNLISGAKNNLGIEISGSQNCTIEGNIIGLNATATAASSPEMCCAIRLLKGSSNNDNILITKNKLGGIKDEALHVEGLHVEIRDNRIGSNAAGTAGFGGATGIVVLKPTSRLVKIEGNQIGFFGNYGIAIDSAQQVDIYANSIFCNTVAGILLQNGANAEVPKPVITATAPGSVSGTSPLTAAGRIEVFKSVNTNCPAATCAQGKEWIGWAAVNNLGTWSYASPQIQAGDVLTVTLTRDGGNFEGHTSAFSECFTVPTVSNTCHVQDSLELIKLYTATNGAGWTNTWDLAKPMNTWYGVQLNNDGCVRRIDLSNNKLKGVIPNLNLPNLEILDMDQNLLSGNIPNFILPQLLVLDLDQNLLDGNIPNLDLPNLLSLWLRDNHLTGTIPDFYLPKLVKLYLENNQLSSAAVFSKLTSMGSSAQALDSLNVWNNRLTFEDILPNMPLIVKMNGKSRYAPQDSVFHDTLLTRAAGQNLDFSLDFDENVASNVYKWYKNGVFQFEITGDNNLKINNINTAHAGKWNVQVTNPGAPQLTLYGRAISINIACAAPTPSISGSATFCPGGNTALSATAGFAIYKWSNNATTANITVNTAATYTVTVTNAAGCTGTAALAVSQGAALTPSISGSAAFCPGGNTALAATAGFATYKWSNNATTANITVNTAATYTVTVTNAAGCTGTAVLAVSQGTALTPSISGSAAFCPGGNTALAATAGFTTYKWSNNATTSNITVSAAATYTVTVTNGAGCTGTAALAVSQGAALTPSISGSATFCPGGNTALAATAGFTTYKWSNNATTSNITVNAAATYTVTVTNAAGCTGTAAQSVKAGKNVLVEITDTLCAGGVYSFCGKALTASGEYPCALKTWQGCDSMVTLRLEVAQPEKIRLGDDQGLLTGNNGKVVLDFLKNDTISVGSDLKIGIAVQPHAGSAEIKDQKLIYNLTAGGFAGTDSFAYRICLSACPEVCDQAWVHVFVPDDLSKYNTNVLTPDVADGINDVFDAVTGLEAQNYRVSSATLRIYSQWGMLVYRETSERPQWNGKTNGKTVPQGTYYYEIKASVGAAEPVTVVGALTVLE